MARCFLPLKFLTLHCTQVEKKKEKHFKNKRGA